MSSTTSYPAGRSTLCLFAKAGVNQIAFGDTTIDCHYAQMDFVDGDSLRDLLDSDNIIPAPKTAQIAIDLYRLLGEFARRKLYHNDLHAGNLIVEKLPDSQRRPEAVDDNVRVKAVDLGSVSDKSTSDPIAQRRGDVRWAANHIRALVERLLQRPDDSVSLEYRLATLLEEHCLTTPLRTTACRHSTSSNKGPGCCRFQNANLRTSDQNETPSATLGNFSGSSLSSAS